MDLTPAIRVHSAGLIEKKFCPVPAVAGSGGELAHPRPMAPLLHGLFKQVRDQVRQRPALEVRSFLQSLVDVPVDRGADPLRLAA